MKATSLEEELQQVMEEEKNANLMCWYLWLLSFDFAWYNFWVFIRSFHIVFFLIDVLRLF